ncbi:MAG: trigger factor [Gammaproteobacteria bacterium]|nr:trigger factor [Gammaproteobacteria bacterium]
MQVSVSTVAGLERRIEVAVPAERVAGEIESRLKQLAKTARLKGFRPGKAPLAVVRQQFASQVQTEVVGDLLRESYSEAVSRENLKPATDPRIENLSAEPGAELRFTALLEVMPEVKVKPVSELAIERPTADITDADIDAMLESMRRQRPDYVAVERPAADGDRVTVDFEGRIGGETFQGGSATGIKFVLGKGQMLAEFEAGVQGAKAGESRNVTVNFPADYGSPTVAGKTAEFALAVTAVEEEKLPAIDDEFCKAFGVAEGGVEALRRDVRESMQRELVGAIRGRVRTAVLDALHDANPIEVPKGMVAETVQSMQVDFARRVGIRDPKQLPAAEGMVEPARRRVALGLVVGEIMRAQDMKVDRERVQARLAELVGDHPQADEMRRQYLQNADAMRQLESATLEDQLIDWVLSQAKVTDKPASFSELTGFGKNQPNE